MRPPVLSSTLRGLLLAALFVGLTWTMFFGFGARNGRPSLTDLDEVSLVAAPDGPLMIWILSWSSHALHHQPAGFFDANIFHPEENSLAYTETLAPLAPVWALLLAGTGDPGVALNLLLLLATVLNLCGGYALAKWLTGRTDAAVLAAVLFAFNGYASAQRVHLQLQMMFLVPVGLLLLFSWLERRRWRDAVLFALAWATLSVTAVYYGLIFSLIVALVLAFDLAARRFRPGPRYAAGLALVLLLAGGLVAPFAAAYLQVPGSQARGALPGYELHPMDVFTPTVGSLIHRKLEELGTPRNEEHRHFPGVLAFALGAVGLWEVTIGRRRRRTDGPVEEGVRRRDGALLALAGAVCLVLSLGPELGGVPLPFALLQEHVPGFDRFRVPARMAFGTLLAGSMLAAFGYARLTERLRSQDRRRRLLAAGVATAAVGFAALENASRTRLFPLPASPRDATVNRALATAPPGAVLELPIATGTGRQPARMEARRMMLSTVDWKPRVNGYSGGYPPGYFRRAIVLNGFPASPAVGLLCELGVRYVVLRVEDPEGLPKLTRQGAAEIVARLPAGARWSRHADDVLIDLAPAGVPDGSACQGAPEPAPLAAAGSTLFRDPPPQVSTD